MDSTAINRMLLKHASTPTAQRRGLITTVTKRDILTYFSFIPVLATVIWLIQLFIPSFFWISMTDSIVVFIINGISFIIFIVYIVCKMKPTIYLIAYSAVAIVWGIIFLFTVYEMIIPFVK